MQFKHFSKKSQNLYGFTEEFDQMFKELNQLYTISSENRKLGTIPNSFYETYSVAALFKTVIFSIGIDMQINMKWNRKPRNRISMPNWFFDKGAKAIQWKKGPFQEIVLELHIWRRNERSERKQNKKLNLTIIPDTKINSKWVTLQSVKL